jgi:signal peptidase
VGVYLEPTGEGVLLGDEARVGVHAREALTFSDIFRRISTLEEKYRSGGYSEPDVSLVDEDNHEIDLDLLLAQLETSQTFDAPPVVLTQDLAAPAMSRPDTTPSHMVDPPSADTPFANTPLWITDSALYSPEVQRPTSTPSEPHTPTGRKSIKPAVFEGLFYLVLIVSVALIFVSGAATSTPRALFGYTPLTVVTGSMQSEIAQGSLIIAKQVDTQTLRIGDNITYLVEGGSTITHQIVGIYENYEGGVQRAFVTQGIENGLPDDEVVYADNVIGKVVYHSFALGATITYIKDNLVFLVPLALLSIGLIYALRTYVTSGKKLAEGSTRGVRNPITGRIWRIENV